MAGGGLGSSSRRAAWAGGKARELGDSPWILDYDRIALWATSRYRNLPMPQLTVDAGLRDKLLEMKGPVALCDDSGRIFGRFTPDLNGDVVEQETFVARFFEPLTFTWT